MRRSWKAKWFQVWFGNPVQSWTLVLSHLFPPCPHFVDSIVPHCFTMAAVVPDITCRCNYIQHIWRVVFPLCVSSYSGYTSHLSSLVRHVYQQETRERGMAIIRRQTLYVQALLGDVVNIRTWPGPLGDTAVYSKSCNIVNWESQPDLTWITLDGHSNESGWGSGNDKAPLTLLGITSEKAQVGFKWLHGNVTTHHADKMWCGDYFL